MTSRKLMIAVAATQLLAAVAFLGINEFVDAGKFVAFRNVSIAHHEGGDVEAELGKSIRTVGAEYYYPSVIFGSFCVLMSLTIGVVAAKQRAR